MKLITDLRVVLRFTLHVSLAFKPSFAFIILANVFFSVKCPALSFQWLQYYI